MFQIYREYRVAAGDRGYVRCHCGGKELEMMALDIYLFCRLYPFLLSA